MTIEQLEKKAAQLRVDILEALYRAEKGYIGSAMSVVEILVSIYYGNIYGRKVANIDPVRPGSDEQDYVVLSKGKTAVTQYSILADLGFFDKSELDFVGKEGAMLKMWPSMKVPGIAASVKSHGVGLSIAQGIAMSLKMDRRPNRVFAVLGDGELQEGAVWEAAMAASHYKLDNLCVFIDANDIQMDGPVRAVMDVGSVQDKFEAFGWKVLRVSDGHNFDEILNAVERAFTVMRRPVCIWCNTVSGKGIDFAEGKSIYHGAKLSEAEMQEIIPKLKSIYGEVL